MLNIKNLQPGSYKIIQAPAKLNVKDLAGKVKYPGGGYADPAKLASLKASQAQAETEANKSTVGRFFRALPGAALDVGVKDVAQFGASAIEAPKQIGQFLTGGIDSVKTSDRTYKIPGLTPFKTLQGEAQQSIQEGNSVGKTILNKGTKAILEGVQTGAYAKGLIGDVNLATGQVTKGYIPKKLGELSDNKIWKTVEPKLIGKNLQAANKAGELKKTGLLRTVKPVKDQELIDAAKPYLKSSDPIKAAKQINNGVEQEANKLIEGVGNRGGTWSVNNLKGAVNETKVPLGVKGVSDAQVEGVKNYVSTLGKDAPKNAGGALKVAKQFRATINDEFGENIWYKDTPIAKYVRSVNRTLNGFAESLLPDGQLADGTFFSDSMRKQTKLFEALDNVVAKTPKVGTNVISKLSKIKTGLEIGGGSILGFEGIKKLLGK